MTDHDGSFAETRLQFIRQHNGHDADNRNADEP
jgi:hypothetical protein